MTFFTSQHFIDHIVRSLDAPKKIKQEHHSTLKMLIELETRTLIETAIKFMRKDRRDTLTLEDIQLAVKQLRHPQLKINVLGTNKAISNSFQQQEESALSSETILEQQMQLLENVHISEPKLQGKWIFVKGKIPKTNNNKDLKCLTQMLIQKELQKQQRSKIMNVIRDEPFSLLTKEQADYFNKIVTIIQKDSNQKGFIIKGDINSIFPFLLKYIGSSPLNLTGITLLVNMLENRYVWRAAEFYLMKILNILLTYQGSFAFEVGLKIAQLVDRFDDKYPVLRDIFEEQRDRSYSTILKQIAFELHLGIPVEFNKKWWQKCEQDAEKGDEMAQKCRNTLLTYVSKLKFLKQHLSKNESIFVYWHPCRALNNDPYLQMF